MQILRFEHAIMVLSGEMAESDPVNPNLNFSKTQAHQYLCDFSGVDLGFDAISWKNWFDERITSAKDLAELQSKYFERLDKRKLQG